jgi:hypothetical protein
MRVAAPKTHVVAAPVGNVSWAHIVSCAVPYVIRPAFALQDRAEPISGASGTAPSNPGSLLILVGLRPLAVVAGSN